MADISVIIPCYNVEKYIDRCLLTITEQTIGVDKLEIICVDDASTDGTVSKLLEWEQKYPEQIIVVCCEDNGRQGRARNIGLSYASAEWISHVDADDWVELDFYEKLYKVTRENDCEIVSCESRRDDGKSGLFFPERTSGKGIRYIDIKTEVERVGFLANKNAGLNAPMKLVKKSLLIDNEIAFPEGVAYEDCYWGMLIHFYVNKVVMLDEILYHYAINNTSTTLQKGAYYHIDYMVVMKRLWKECERRGLLQKYRAELELEVIATFYCDFLKMLSLKFDNPPYSYYMVAQIMVRECVPDFRKNYYVSQGGFPEAIMDYIGALESVNSKKEFEDLIERVRTEKILY